MSSLVDGLDLPTDLVDARQAVRRLLAGARWAGDHDQVMLAVHEALSNAMRHGGGLRWARAWADGDTVRVEVADHGETFDPSPYIRATPDVQAERGRGIWLIGQIATAYEVEADGEGSVVRLEFAPGRAPAAREAPRRAMDAIVAGARPLISSVTVGVLIIDDGLRVRDANRVALEMFEVDADDVRGIDIRAVATRVRHLFREPDEFLDRILYLHAHPEVEAEDLLPMKSGALLRRRSIPIHDTDGGTLGRLDSYSYVQEEGAIIASMQRALLPELPAWDGLDIAALYHPATAGSFVGGDFYDFVDLPGGGRCAVIGDVSGRGASAAAVSAAVRAYLRASLRSRGVSGAFVDLDRTLSRELDEEEFVTLLAVMEEGPDVWTALSCGHEPPLLFSGGAVRAVDVRGEILGFDIPSVRPRTAFRLAPGDTLLLYTDGVADAGYGSQRFGLRRLREILAEYGHLPADELVAAIDQRVHEFAAGRLPDDHAIVAVRRR